MEYVINGVAFLGTFAFMEFVAWSMHKYVMHTFLWSLHRDHHQKDQDHFLELNDVFFIVFAIPGILLIYYGFQGGGLIDVRFWIGLGISVYGIAYVVAHDIFIHQRIPPWLKRTDNAYFRAMRKAHKVHHKHLGKEDGECFGFLWVPPKYIKAEIQRKSV